MLGGIGVAAALVAFDTLVSDTFDSATVDLLHISLHPWDSGRLALLAGALLSTAAVVWGCATLLLGTRLPWRVPHRKVSYILTSVTVWALPGVVLVAAGWVATTPFATMLVGSVGLAVAVPFLRPRFRHGSHAARVLTVFLALLLPAFLAYPSLLHHGERTKQRFVETRYAVQAAAHP